MDKHFSGHKEYKLLLGVKKLNVKDYRTGISSLFWNFLLKFSS